jgi:hypothetical protein
MKNSDSAVQIYHIEKILDAPIKACFDAACHEDAIQYWAPGCKSVVYDHSKAEYPYGPGSSRLVTLNNGSSLTEVIDLAEEPNLVGYTISAFGNVADKLIKNYHGRMRFEVIDDTHTKMVWKGYAETTGWRSSVSRFLFPKITGKMAKKFGEYVAKK